MSFALTPANIEDIKAHARRDYPNEACGLIVDGAYVPCQNVASSPEKDFVIAAAMQVNLKAAGKTIQAVVHSHPNGPFFPSAADMKGQMETNLPWVLVATDGKDVSPPEVWGGDAPLAPVLGRSFLHGIRDCYSLCRDVYGLGKAELAKQGVNWSLDPIVLPDFARDDSWWGDPKTLKESLYVENYQKAGFVQIPRESCQPGDAFMMSIRAKTPNHAGVLCSDGLILHHLPGRLSGRMPAGLWARAAEIWLRYEGKPHAS